MDFEKAMVISGSGMSVQRLRMNVISSNLANANSTKTAEGGPYRRREVVFKAAGLTKFGERLDSALDRQLRGVGVSQITYDQTPFRILYNPSHPHADKDGYVRMPNVNLVQEMADMIDASRSYEANLAAMNTSKNMALKALDLAR